MRDKVWVHGPGREPWEVYTVKADAGALDGSGDSACRAPAGASAGPGREADAAASCR